MRRLPLLVVAIVIVASCGRTVNVEQEKAALMTADAEWAKSDQERRHVRVVPGA